MLFSVVKNVKIAGLSAVIPNRELSLLDDKNLYEGDKRRIERVIKSSGFLKRRVTDASTTTADLCEQAAVALLKGLNENRKSIDAIVFVSYTPDYLMPATAYVLHNKLGLGEHCLAMDMPQACSGYVLGLYQAGLLLNGGCKKVLLLVGDSFSKFSDMFRNLSAPIFGDAGSATLLEYDPNAEPMYFNIMSDSSKYNALICRNGGFRNPPTKDRFYENGSFKYDAEMKGGEIFEFAIQKVAPFISELLNRTKIKKDDIDYFVLHQANRYILENIALQLDIGMEKVPCDTLTNYGNQCGASVPCVLADKLSGKISSEPLSLLLSGFGVGLSATNVLLKTRPMYCSGLKVFEAEGERVCQM